MTHESQNPILSNVFIPLIYSLQKLIHGEDGRFTSSIYSCGAEDRISQVLGIKLRGIRHVLSFGHIFFFEYAYTY